MVFIFSLFSTLNAESNFSYAVKVKKIYPMGKKIYEKRCSSINLSEYKSKKELKDTISSKKLCKNISSKYLDAVTLYLWEVKRVHKTNVYKEIPITKHDKCPICGMFVYKYPRWIAQLAYKNHHYSFDGCKDMMKYYFSDKNSPKEIIVRDYYTQKIINGREAYYVIGSNVLGAMGNELIPFKTLKSAKTFYFDHEGKKILRFNEITSKEVYKLDE